MNNFSLYTFRLYHYLLTVRDTLEYTIKREHKVEVYESRKKILTENLEEGTPFGDFLKNNGETGDKIKEKIKSFIDELYSENSTILIPSGENVRVDVAQIVTLYDMTVGIAETLRDIVYQYINYGMKNEDVDQKLVQLVGEDERMYRVVLSMLVMLSFQESFAEFQKVMNESKGQPTPQSNFIVHHNKILNLIKDETRSLAEKYGDDRRTEIVANEVEQINVEDMIKDEDMVVMISRMGYIKRVPVTKYKKQGRGGTGSNGTNLLDDDYVNQLFIGSTKEHLLFITNLGRAYWMKIHEIPESEKAARGAHIKGLLQVGPDEEITTVVSLKEFSDDLYLFMTTAQGVVKKVRSTEFVNAKTRGIIGIKLNDGDKLISAIATTGTSEVMLISRRGKALRITEDSVRVMGRASCGIRGMKLSEGDEIASAVKVEADSNMILLTEKGVGKRISFDLYSVHGRGTGGQRIFGNTESKGEIIGAINVKDKDEVVCMTSQGKTLRFKATDIKEQGTGASGVNVVRVTEPDFIVGLDKVQLDKTEDE